MADYGKAILKLLPKEGLYDNDPDDSGGETVWGVSRKNHPSDPIWIIVDENKAKPGFPLNLEQDPRLKPALLSFYKRMFWDKVRADEIHVQSVAEEIFDTAVNCGVGAALKITDRLLNVGNRDQADYPDEPVDGVMSDSNLKNLHLLILKRGEFGVLKALNCLQGARYFGIVEEKPKQEKYLWGWLINRA